MCLRYSSSVVAPTARNSPRASIGFSRLPADTAPSAAPAPTIVCSSSMKRTISPSAAVISASTALSRSSNSPRYFAPAISEPTSSAQTRFPFSPSGTSPATIRCASPSAIAVLPTPGSPISTGLFFVRRESTWIVRRISSSRPITGSSLPGLGGGGEVAAELRQRLVGALGILRRHALAAAHLLQRAEQRLARHEVEREHEVLDRDELVVELARLVEGVVEHLAEGAACLWLRVRARHRGQRPQACLGLGQDRARVGAGALKQRPRQLLLEQRHREVVADQLRVAGAARELLRAGDCLAGLDRQLVEVHGQLSCRRLGSVEDDLAPVLPVGLVDLRPEGRLELLHPRPQPPELVLEAQHVLDAGEVEPELRRQLLDQPQPLDVVLGVEPRAARRARGRDEALRLVRAQRLRVHAGELGGDGDHVARAVGS